MVVYVRVSAEDPDAEDYSPDPRQPTVSPRRPRPHLDEAFQMLPPIIHNQLGARADSRNTRRTQSPQPGRGRRSESASTHARRVRPSAKSRGNSSHGSFAEAHGDMYSDSDGENGSVTSSRRSRKEPLASADISVDNIVEGGRRKRAKFDSSVSRSLAWTVHAADLTPALLAGATAVRSSAGPDDCVAVVCFSSTTNQWKHSWLALLDQPTNLFLLAPSTFATKLWTG